MALEVAVSGRDGLVDLRGYEVGARKFHLIKYLVKNLRYMSPNMALKGGAEVLELAVQSVEICVTCDEIKQNNSINCFNCAEL